MEEKIISLKMSHVKAKVPTKATEGSAGFDLYTPTEFEISPGGRKVIPLGFSMKLPQGYYAMVCSRSGLAAKHGVMVLNAPGIIDNDYRGEIGVILYNTDDTFSFKAEIGDRIAQMIVVDHNIQPYNVIDHLSIRLVDSLPETDRGAGGYGSTGK